MTSGSLTVVGTGFRGTAQITVEAGRAIESAQKALFLTSDYRTERWITDVNPTAESLAPFYAGRRTRLQAYLDMVEHILTFVRSGLRVCVIFYGHPGVVVFLHTRR